MYASHSIRIWLLCGALLSMYPRAASGQAPTSGEQILVTYTADRNGPLVYRYRRTVELELVTIDSGHLFGRYHGSVLAIDLESIRSLKRRVGTKPASAPAMVAGSAAGFVAGFVAGAVLHSNDAPEATRSAADEGLSTGVLLGAPAGALLAWLASRSRPLYEEVDLNRLRLRPRIVGSLSGGLGLSVSISTR